MGVSLVKIILGEDVYYIGYSSTTDRYFTKLSKNFDEAKNFHKLLNNSIETNINLQFKFDNDQLNRTSSIIKDFYDFTNVVPEEDRLYIIKLIDFIVYIEGYLDIGFPKDLMMYLKNRVDELGLVRHTEKYTDTVVACCDSIKHKSYSKDEITIVGNYIEKLLINYDLSDFKNSILNRVNTLYSTT